MAKSGNIFVVSAPSGTGKRTILNRILAMDDQLELTVSSTTRPPRKGETAGVDIYFQTSRSYDSRFSETLQVISGPRCEFP